MIAALCGYCLLPVLAQPPLPPGKGAIGISSGIGKGINSGVVDTAAQNLRQKYASLQNALAHNQFGRALVLESGETDNTVHGDIYALVNYPLASVRQALHSPANWCDLMLLHINTKYCYAQIAPDNVQLRIYLGKKTPEALRSAARLDFRYRVQMDQAEILTIALNAPQGPMGTSDYRIVLEALALPDDKTLIHLSYAYASNLVGRTAMRVYLNTVAKDKVGFTASAPRLDNGSVACIGGIRGLVERNTMRYYLAIESYLGAATLPAASQFDARLQSWFSATERYPRQLHEIGREQYISMKHDEYQRQQTLQ
ncbi:MAG: hypothetical protein RL748_969 [Pseudomonadota bacterium]